MDAADAAAEAQSAAADAAIAAADAASAAAEAQANEAQAAANAAPPLEDEGGAQIFDDPHVRTLPLLLPLPLDPHVRTLSGNPTPNPNTQP